MRDSFLMNKKVLLFATLGVVFSFTLCSIGNAKEKNKELTPVKDTISKATTVRELIKKGEFEKALTLCKELGEEGTFLEAEISYFKGDFDAAIKLYMIVSADSKLANDALKRIIFLRENKGGQLKEYVEAELLGEKGELGKGIKILRNIAKDTTSLLADDALHLVGELLQNDMKFKQALKEYRNLIDKFPNSSLCPSAYVRTGEIYETNLHKKEKAREAYETFLLRYPKNAMAPFVRKRLDDL